METVNTDGFIAECFFTYVLDDKGTVTANGPFHFDPDEGVIDSVLAITGGTGNYKGATGEVREAAETSVLGAGGANLWQVSWVSSEQVAV